MKTVHRTFLALILSALWFVIGAVVIYATHNPDCQSGPDNLNPLKP